MLNLPWDEIENRPLSQYFTMREVAIIQMGNRHAMTSKFEFQTSDEKQAGGKKEYEQVMKNKQFYMDLLKKMRDIKGKKSGK